MEPIGKADDVFALHHFSKHNRISHILFSRSSLVGDGTVQMRAVIVQWLKVLLHFCINETPIVRIQDSPVLQLFLVLFLSRLAWQVSRVDVVDAIRHGHGHSDGEGVDPLQHIGTSLSHASLRSAQLHNTIPLKGDAFAIHTRSYCITLSQDTKQSLFIEVKFFHLWSYFGNWCFITVYGTVLPLLRHKLADIIFRGERTITTFMQFFMQR